MKSFTLTCLSLVLGLMSSAGIAQDGVPKHLQIARKIVAEVKPENNNYSPDKRYIRMPGDLFASTITVNTDCSGFVEEAFYRAGNPITGGFSQKKFKSRYILEDYLHGFKNEEGVKLVNRVEDIRPGDVIIWKFSKPVTRNGHNYNGHVMLVDTIPVMTGENVKRKKADGLQTWNVKILDTTQSPKSEDDTRYKPNTGAEDDDTEGAVQQGMGAGRGTIRLFSDSTGRLAAVSFGFKKPNVRLTPEEWTVYVGRKTY